MGTSLSFHNRYSYTTDRLVLVALTAVFFSLINIQEISCAVIGLPNSLSMDTEVHNIRHIINNERKIELNLNQINPVLSRSPDVEGNMTDLYTGIYSIKNDCSNRYVSIYAGDITASAENKNQSAAQIEFVKILGVENQFYIRRKSSALYLCITRRGKLVGLAQPTRDDRCSFTQIPIEPSTHSDNRYVKIQSVAQSLWYIGFKKNGSSMKGWQYGIKRDKCFFHRIEKNSSAQMQSLTNHQQVLSNFDSSGT